MTTVIMMGCSFFLFPFQGHKFPKITSVEQNWANNLEVFQTNPDLLTTSQNG